MNPALDRFLAGYEGSQIMVNPRGVEILASDKGVPITGCIAAVVLPTADAFAAIDATQQRMLQATVLLTSLAGGLTWWLLRRNLAPVSDTVRALTALGHSAQPLQAVSVRSTGELGQLVSAFNALLSRLAQHEQASRQSRTMLARTEAIAHVGSWEWDVKSHVVTYKGRRHPCPTLFNVSKPCRARVSRCVCKTTPFG